MSIPTDLKYWPEAKQKEYFRSLPKMELFDLLLVLSEELFYLVDSWDEIILDGLDEQLEHDQSSKIAMQNLLKQVSI